MAKRKSSRTIPQAQHGPRSGTSRHDKRRRLSQRDPQRERTMGAKIPVVGELADATLGMSRLLDVRIAFRLPIVVAGMLLAGGKEKEGKGVRNLILTRRGRLSNLSRHGKTIASVPGELGVSCPQSGQCPVADL